MNFELFTFRLIYASVLFSVANTANCWEDSTWPKLIGWKDSGVTEVKQIDFSSSRNELAMGISSNEP